MATETATTLRETGISVVGKMPWGTHFCHFYETKEDLLDILIPYFKTGLENNEFCMWVVFDPINEDEARDALRGAIPGIERRFAAGDIEIVAHSQWYLRNGTFDLQRVIEGWKEKLNQAVANGYAGLRVNGNEGWLTGRHWKDFSDYEGQLNRWIANQQVIVLCAYPLAVRSASEVFDVARAHQFAVAKRFGKWEVVATPELIHAREEIVQLNKELEERVAERTRELGATNDELRTEILERNLVENQLKGVGEQLRALSIRLDRAREEEASRIARELHDELGSALTSLKWDMECLAKLCSERGTQETPLALDAKIKEIMTLIDAIIETVRKISSELRPHILDDLGLVAAIVWQAKQFEYRTGITCQCDSLVEMVDLTREQSTALFRIFQEAMTNILRHAQATRIKITIRAELGEFVLEVRDNGKGISKEDIASPGSLGLIGMRERAHLAGGRSEITGVAGKGTVLTVRVPIGGTVSDSKTALQ